MKRRIMLAFVCICAGGMSAGGAVPDSLIISAAMANASSQKVFDTAKSSLPSSVVKNRTVLGFLKTVYGKFISSQDGNTCSFTQSCSNFCVWAVQRKGVIKGALLTADRLTRCNGIQPGRYEIDSLSGKNVDDIPGLLK